MQDFRILCSRVRKIKLVASELGSDQILRLEMCGFGTILSSVFLSFCNRAEKHVSLNLSHENRISDYSRQY